MAQITLSAKTRSALGHKTVALRARGTVPCVTYGHGIKTASIEVNAKQLEKVIEKAGTSTIVELDLDGSKKNIVIHDVQYHPVSGAVIHADLYQVRMDEKIKAEVPLKFTGVSRAVKDFGGILVKSVDKLEIEALPKDLPHEILVDLSKLVKLNDSIPLKSLDIPAGVEVLVEDKELAIVSVTPPRSEAELEALNEAVTEDVNAIEGVKPKEEGEEIATAEGEGEKAAGKGKEAPAKEAGAGKEAAKPEAKPSK
ncbi:MAG: 50S ribosomal protein L25 [Candidatus Andersenbacteria bacterium]